MKLVARIHALYASFYERCMSYLTRLDPKSLKRAQDKPWKVPWEPGTLHHCRLCSWRSSMLWDEEAYRWQCPSCGHRCYPTLAITEKRPVVHPVQVLLLPMPGIEQHTEPHNLHEARKALLLPEQRAVQPPVTPHIFSLAKEPKKEKYVPGRYLKAITGEIEMRDGKPCHKDGTRVNTEQFKRIIFPPINDGRLG